MPPSISPSRTPLPRRRRKQKRERSPAFSRNFAKTARASARAVFCVWDRCGGEGCFQDEPSQSPTATALPRGEPLAKRAGFVLTGQRQKKPADKRKTFRLCQSLSLSGEVARRSRDGEGCFRDEPSQSRCARQLVPLFVAWRRHLPPAGGSLSKGEPLAKRAGFVLTRQRLEEVSR